MEEGAVYDYRVIARNGKKASVASQPSAPVRVKRQKPPRSEQMNKGKWTRMKKKKKKKKKEKEKEIEKEKKEKHKWFILTYRLLGLLWKESQHYITR